MWLEPDGVHARQDKKSQSIGLLYKLRGGSQELTVVTGSTTTMDQSKPPLSLPMSHPLTNATRRDLYKSAALTSWQGDDDNYEQYLATGKIKKKKAD